MRELYSMRALVRVSARNETRHESYSHSEVSDNAVRVAKAKTKSSALANPKNQGVGHFLFVQISVLACKPRNARLVKGVLQQIQILSFPVLGED